MNKAKLSLVMAGLLAAAACTTERVVLLPSADGARSAVVVRDKQGEVLLDQPYAAIKRQSGANAGSQSSPEAAHARQIDLGLTSADEAPVRGYPDALDMLVRNLLDNAIKYTPPGGTVNLEIASVDGAPLLRVDDSGPGIAPDERERVLDRFYRIAGSDASGSGLGLPIVKATLALLPSPSLGGLRVEVRFPAA